MSSSGLLRAADEASVCYFIVMCDLAITECLTLKLSTKVVDIEDPTINYFRLS